MAYVANTFVIHQNYFDPCFYNIFKDVSISYYSN